LSAEGHTAYADGSVVAEDAGHDVQVQAIGEDVVVDEDASAF